MIFIQRHTAGTAFCYAAAIISLIITGGLILNYFAVKNFYKRSIGFNLPKDSIILESYDTHGGFQGDGEFYAVVQLNKMQLKQVEADIANNKSWNRMSLSKYLSEGSSWFTEEKHIDKKRKYEMPVNTENGYYYFQDRHNEPDKEKMPFWDRGSFNFTIAILDINTGRLYVYLMDT